MPRIASLVIFREILRDRLQAGRRQTRVRGRINDHHETDKDNTAENGRASEPRGASSSIKRADVGYFSRTCKVSWSDGPGYRQ